MTKLCLRYNKEIYTFRLDTFLNIYNTELKVLYIIHPFILQAYCQMNTAIRFLL